MAVVFFFIVLSSLVSGFTCSTPYSTLLPHFCVHFIAMWWIEEQYLIEFCFPQLERSNSLEILLMRAEKGEDGGEATGVSYSNALTFIRILSMRFEWTCHKNSVPECKIPFIPADRVANQTFESQTISHAIPLWYYAHTNSHLVARVFCFILHKCTTGSGVNLI